MHHVHEPRAYALDDLAIIRQLWHGVRDGDVESVHQARVATRRIRAALPVIDGVDNEDVKLFRTIGRCLGSIESPRSRHETHAPRGRPGGAAARDVAGGRGLD